MSDPTQNAQPKPGEVQTTGHAWDGDLQEYNNPLPRWWLWCFYGTVLFSVLYWIYYPSWPVGESWLKGVGTVDYTITDTITEKDGGLEVVTVSRGICEGERVDEKATTWWAWSDMASAAAYRLSNGWIEVKS